MAFLGHVIFAEDLAVDPSKIEVVQGWKAPYSASKIKSFLRLAGYYQKFVKEFSRRW